MVGSGWCPNWIGSGNDLGRVPGRLLCVVMHQAKERRGDWQRASDGETNRRPVIGAWS